MAPSVNDLCNADRHRSRLSLSNNYLSRIPYRFHECAHLRYLNIRANNFREIPKGVGTFDTLSKPKWRNKCVV